MSNRSAVKTYCCRHCGKTTDKNGYILPIPTIRYTLGNGSVEEQDLTLGVKTIAFS
jgi:hypothetical protein